MYCQNCRVLERIEKVQGVCCENCKVFDCVESCEVLVARIVRSLNEFRA